MGAILLLAAMDAASAAAEVVRADGVVARVAPDRVALSNRLVERSWRRSAFATEDLRDRRGRQEGPGGIGFDFTLWTSAGRARSDDFELRSARVVRLGRGGLRVSMRLTPRPLGAPAALPLEVTRIAEAYPGVAGFRSETIVRSAVPVTITRATIEELAAEDARPTLHAFRGGADWREPGYEGPPLAVGDPHAGTWRETRSAPSGGVIEGPAQWLALDRGRGRLFATMERNDFPSSRASYDGRRGRLTVDYSRDVLSLGPLEEQLHIENPLPAAGRSRTVAPGNPLRLAGAFTGVARGAADEGWQFHRYLVGHRLRPYPRAVTFNTNGVDSDRISTGAKDDADLATVRELARVARRLGVETFVLDDGWQARSGDWHPDSPRYPEPRYDGSGDSKFAPRFPDARFRAVRRTIAPMRLGLWMSPLMFHPSSATYRRHPEWICHPVGDGLLAFNALQPEDGSNEAGIVPWSAAAIPHVESRIREGIERWKVRYWKFDFMVWLDCAGAGDLYDHHDAFMAMIDRLREDYRKVTFQIDETNDYRMFPFESTTRGPTWFQNGAPPVDRLLHNLWNLSPYVPSFALGQHVLGGEAFRDQPVATLMAAALLSHITFFHDIRELPQRIVGRASRWLDFYRRRRGLLDGVVYPLLRDPLELGWTALQSWNPEEGRGALLAFRQDDGDRSRRVKLRNVPGGMRFELREAPSGRRSGEATSAELRRGLRVSLRRDHAEVLAITPAGKRK